MQISGTVLLKKFVKIAQNLGLNPFSGFIHGKKLLKKLLLSEFTFLLAAQLLFMEVSRLRLQILKLGPQDIVVLELDSFGELQRGQMAH